MRLSPLSALLAVAVVAAGCSTTGPAGSDGGPSALTVDPFPPFVPPAPTFDFSTVIDPDHAHEVPELHTGGHGLEVVGHVGLQDILPVGTRGSITQVDVWGDWAVVSGMEGGLAFAIIDIKDPAAPKAVSWYPSTADGWTARFSDDGNYVFYGCQTLGPLNPQSSVEGTCVDASKPHAPGEEGNGIVAVNVTDRANPRFAAFVNVQGSHNLQTANINGTDYVFTEITEIVAFDRATQTFSVAATVPGVHDATAQRHPATGRWVLYTGASNSFRIYDIENPADPKLLYDGPSSDPWTGWHEQTPIPHLVDGRALVILAGESFVNIPQEGSTGDVVSIVNVTDPTHPQLLGTWRLPIKPTLPWQGYMFSAHEIAATPTGQVAIGWYHGGAWVFDVSTKDRQAKPVTLAAFQPHDLPNVVPATFFQVPVPLVPFVWGAGWTHQGYLVVPDMHTGLYVLKPEWGLHPSLDGGQ
ncbi:MAG: hypothetical protein V4510_00835 [bacterium]